MCSCSWLLQAGKVGEWEMEQPTIASCLLGLGNAWDFNPLTPYCLLILPTIPALPACCCPGPCISFLWDSPSLRAAVLQISLHRLNPSPRLNVIYHTTEGVVI